MIIITGVAGSGKSTEGQQLARELGYEWISIGQMLRDHVDAARQQELIEGKMLDDQEVIAILQDVIAGVPAGKEILLDGFPRTPHQADWLLGQHQQGRLRVRAVIHLVASEAVVKRRLLARARPDDNEEAIKLRFAEYEQTILPVLARFKAANVPVYDINAEQSPQDVHRDVLAKLKV